VTRGSLLGLSVIDCVFGVVALTSDGSTKTTFLMLNFLLAVVLAILTAQDLRHRGWSWRALVIGASYAIAPLVGLIAYAIASDRPKIHRTSTA
jgi:hypothetical protein